MILRATKQIMLSSRVPQYVCWRNISIFKVRFPLCVSRFQTLWPLLSLLIAGFEQPLVQAQDTVIPNGATWRWHKGTNEVSTPNHLWRNYGFNDATWLTGAAPFHYGESLAGGTLLSDMQNGYTCVFLRTPFVITNVPEVASVQFVVNYDDGFVAWINGTEVARAGVTNAAPAYTNTASISHEAGTAEVITVTNLPINYLLAGTNVLAVQGFNLSLSGSSDFRFETRLEISKLDLTPPGVTSVVPTPGDALSALTQITVTFSKPVSGVNAADLLINGQPAATVNSGSADQYTFTFPSPSSGSVLVGWDALHDISDLNGNAFDANAPGATWSYQLADLDSPYVIETTPAKNVRVGKLTQVEILFNEPVTGVNAGDLLIKGSSATNVTGVLSGPYVFQFPQPSAGPVQFAWAGGHGITDLATVPNAFAGGNWTNTLDLAYGLPTVRINEFLASNVDTNGLKDEFGNLEDWIELYNFGGTSVDLAGCSLTDDAAKPDKWVFPAVTLGANQYLVVFASGLDRKIVGGTNKLHTSFSLSSGGENLGLFNAESPRVVMDEFAPGYPEQRNDHSYGRDTVNALRYFATPTPGAPNGSSSITGVVANVNFSVERGFFDLPFTLLLTTLTPNATIRYTTDGSSPTESTGTIYNNALQISQSTILRAAAFKANMLPALVGTHTYIYLSNVLNQPTNPPGFPINVWNLSGQTSDYGMDRRIVTNSLYSNTITSDLLSLPALSIVLRTEDMFGGSGVKGIYTNTVQNNLTEVPCSIELINPDGSDGFQIDAGIRQHGGSSRNNPMKKPFGLKFRGKYGAGKLIFPLFPDTPVDEFNSLVLRPDYNNAWTHSSAGEGLQRSRGTLVRDAFYKDVFGAMGALSSHSRYVHLYINGLYWGVYNPCEDPDNDFAASHLGGDGSQYDAVKGAGSALSVDGDLVAYNAMLALNNSGLANLAQYEAIQEHLDVLQYADYMVHQLYGGNNDWGTRQNWAAVRPRTNGGQFKFVCWDSERVLEGTNDNKIGTSPENLQANLILNAEYKLLFADRIHKHLFNDGALTPVRLAKMWRARASQIDRAIVGETARWGDATFGGKPALSPLPYPSYTTSLPYTREENWLGEQGRLLTNYFPFRTAIALNQFRSAGWYPFLDAPEFYQFGGRVASGFNLVITSAASTIYYTLNGTDPRVYGSGAVSGSATAYSGPVTLTSNLVVKARVLNGGEWSALTEAVFTVGGLGVPLRITEIMYNPPGGNAYEFLELQNVGALPVDVSGFNFEGVTFLIPNGTIIPPGGVLLLANSTSPSQFATRYPGVSVFGHYTGNLDNGGERIAILDRNGQVVTAVHYDDEDGWPTAPDGGGYSLEIIDTNGDPNAPANWRASAAVNGTPGSPSTAPAAGNVVLNEIAAENLGSVTNGGLFPDWIELYNRGSNTVSLADWSLSDDSNARKFVIPSGTNLPAGGYLVIWCDTATNAPGLHTGFALGRNGETVSLFDNATNRVDAFTFGLQLPNHTVGRVGGNWQLTVPSPNTTNIAVTLASMTNLVVNEWLADPAVGGKDWLELFNRSSNAPVALQGMYFSTSNALFQYTAHSFVAPRGYAQLFADEQAGADQLEFKLPAAGGAIALADGTGLEFERVTYGAQTAAVSQGRLPDGAVTITSFPGSASPAASNYLLSYTGAILNEVLARYDSVTNGSDWVELFNPNGTPVDVSGMGLGDKPDKPAQWLFPAGTTLAANSYLVVSFDSSRAASTNAGPNLNTGRSLSGEGGGVYLFNTNGQPVDTVEYGFQIKNQSIGRSGGSWQLLATPTPGANNSAPASLGAVASLRFNEWLANSASDGDWFELYNTNTLPVSLTGLFLTDNPSLAGQNKFRVGPLSFVPPRGWVELFADDESNAGNDHVNFRLNEQGESLLLYATNLAVIDSIAFGLQTTNVSQGRLPDGGTSMVSFPTTPTPGRANYLPLTSGVFINEVLTHTDPPLSDAIELFNPAGTNVAIGGWYLSNNQGDLKRYRITNGVVIASGGFRVFYENQFNGAGATSPFTLNSAHGDEAWLSEADAGGNLTGYRTGISFDAAANGVSFGRYQTSVGVDFVSMSARTFGVDNPATVEQFRTGAGASNAYPLVGPVVINQIMYHPPEWGTNAPDVEEFIELLNITGAPVPLFDSAHATNRWRLDNAVTFEFAANTTIPANGSLFVVPFNPATDTAALAAFEARYGTGAALAGPYSGKLDNAGETIELWRPDAPQTAPHPDAGFVPQLLVERVTYSDSVPWPVSADGGGYVLRRIVPANYGNDPANWQAALPAVGSATVPPPTGTATLPGGGIVRLSFAVQPGRSYQVEYKDNLTDANWLPFGAPIVANSSPLIVDDNLTSQPQRFYRLAVLP